MKKTVLVGLIFLSFSLLFSPESVFSQQQSERWVCLKSTHCWEEKPESSACIIKNGHRAKLEADPTVKPLPNKETYLIECLATKDGQICTTGNSETDMVVYKQNNLPSLKTAVDYTFQGLFAADGVSSTINPLMSKASGDIDPVYWQSSSSGTSRKFLALNYYTPVPTAAAGAGGALQQGTIGFDFASAEKDCLSIAWDPYGRVFDSQSLEPVMGASVTLLMKRTGGSFTMVTTNDVLGGNIINPQTVEENGGFSFVVPDGTYKLTVADAGHTFPITDLTTIHPNYLKIYSDIYPAGTGEEIVQAGAVQHRDIPVKAKGSPTNNPPKLMEYFYDAKPITQKIVIEGTVSHPFTKIAFYSKMNNVRHNQLAEIQADKQGRFKIEIDSSKFEPGEIFGEATLTKTDLTLLSNKEKNILDKVLSFLGLLVEKVEAQALQSTTIKFDPILTYVEGYAYDNLGQVIPNATVSVYLKFSNKPYSQTKADEKGYYKITSASLPTMPYELRYTTVNGTAIKTSTTNFVNQNQKYLADNQVDAFVYKDQKGKKITKKDILPTVVPGNNNVSGQTGGKISPTGGLKQTNNLLVLIGVLVFLLISVIVILVIYMIKKKQTEILPPVV